MSRKTQKSLPIFFNTLTIKRLLVTFYLLPE
nr:MAG TPA: hypothetical protein [Caudoviricetes sp.]